MRKPAVKGSDQGVRSEGSVHVISSNPFRQIDFFRLI